jgi:hypothetical protein
MIFNITTRYTEYEITYKRIVHRWLSCLFGDFRKIGLRARACGSWHESFKEAIDFNGPYKSAFQIVYHLSLELIRDSVAR